MKRKKCLGMLLGMLLWTVFLCFSAHAAAMPDLTRQSSISVTMRYKGKAVPGGSLTLYRVGDVAEKDGSCQFVLNDTFSGSRVSLKKLASSEVAASLAQYAVKQKAEGTVVTIGDQGTASFAGLRPGLFLICQEKAAKGYTKINPFLVTVPMQEEGVYQYDVDASPKVQLKQTGVIGEVPPSNPPDNPPGSGKTGKLPQTGQLNWPIPVLAVAGLICILLGWRMRSRRE